MAWFLLLIGGLGCAPEVVWPPACESLCDELVNTCGYEAYPEHESCLEACVYDIEQEYDVEAQADCVELASCDLFAIVDCQREAAD